LWVIISVLIGRFFGNKTKRPESIGTIKKKKRNKKKKKNRNYPFNIVRLYIFIWRSEKHINYIYDSILFIVFESMVVWCGGNVAVKGHG